MKKKLLLIIFLILISIHTKNICIEKEEILEQIDEEEIGQVIENIENLNNMEIDLNEIFESALSRKNIEKYNYKILRKNIRKRTN